MKNKGLDKKKKSRRLIIISSSVLFPILGLFYFSYLLNIGLDYHYDIRKGTFLWYATMDNKTITEFPVLEPIENATYNSIGGNSPNIGKGWGVEYRSKKNAVHLKQTILDYLKREGFDLNEVNETKYNWPGKYKRSKNNSLFAGSNKKGESLDLLFQEEENRITRIECTIVY